MSLEDLEDMDTALRSFARDIVGLELTGKWSLSAVDHLVDKPLKVHQRLAEEMAKTARIEELKAIRVGRTPSLQTEWLHNRLAELNQRRAK